MVIQVNKLVPHATTNQHGEVVLSVVLRELEENERVVVSFEGISVVTSSFTNVAFGNLLEHIDFPTLQKRVSVVKSSRLINDVIKRSISNRIKFSR
jgi:STAS-like domain of unknown function (DUF4325)